MTTEHPHQSTTGSPPTDRGSAPAQTHGRRGTPSPIRAAARDLSRFVLGSNAAQEHGWRGTASAIVAALAIVVGLAFGIGGGLQALYTADIGAADRSDALGIGGPASIVWSVTFAGSFLITNPAQRLVTLQRVMFWMAGAGVAFLALPWVQDDAAADALDNLALFWVLGGSLGILLEPARTLASTPRRYHSLLFPHL